MPSQKIIKFASIIVFSLVKLASSSQGADLLSIDESVRLALANNPAVVAARADTAAALARVESARSGGLPQVGVGAQYSHITSPTTFTLPTQDPNTPPISVAVGTTDSLVGTISLRQSLYTGGRIRGQVSQAEANYDLALARQSATEVQVSEQARELFYGVRLGESLVVSTTESLSSARKQLADAQLRFDTGVAAKFDVLRAQTAVSDAEQTLTQSANQEAIARLSLNRVMGVPQTNIYQLADTGLAPLPIDTADALVVTAIRQRAEVLGARAQVAASDAGIRIARSQGLPEVDASANYQAVSNESGVQRTGWTFLLSGSLSIFNGGKTRADIDTAKSLVDQAKANLIDVTQSVELEVRQEYLNLQSARKNIDTASTRLAQASEAYDVSTVRYQAGVGTATELADAFAQLAGARTSLDSARYNYNIAYARLQRALGLATY